MFLMFIFTIVVKLNKIKLGFSLAHHKFQIVMFLSLGQPLFSIKIFSIDPINNILPITMAKIILRKN